MKVLCAQTERDLGWGGGGGGGGSVDDATVV